MSSSHINVLYKEKLFAIEVQCIISAWFREYLHFTPQISLSELAGIVTNYAGAYKNIPFEKSLTHSDKRPVHVGAGKVVTVVNYNQVDHEKQKQHEMKLQEKKQEIEFSKLLNMINMYHINI